MRKLLLIALISQGFLGIAQDQFLGFQSGFTLGRTKLGNFKEYSKQYNADFGPILETKLSKMTFTSGYEIGLVYAFYNYEDIGFSMEIINERKSAQTSARFMDPALGTRVFQAKYTANSLLFNTNYTIDEWTSTVGILIGFSYTNLSAFKRYEDGSISYGNENGSNLIDEVRSFYSGLKLGAEYAYTDNIRFYSNILLGVSPNITADTPMNLSNGPFPLIYVNTHFTFQLGIKAGLIW